MSARKQLPRRLRGYGIRHVKLRASYEPLVNAGLIDCTRCGNRIDPGTPWDLGHVDGDQMRYAGPEHAACNRATAGRRRIYSRKW